MDRTYASGAAGSAPAAPASPSIGYPTAGNPGTGTPATKPGPYWYHMIAEEIRKVITDAGLTPDHTNLGQLSAAITARIAAVGGAYTAAGGIGINANRTIAAGEINGWGQIQAAGTTTTLPTLASTRVGASFSLSGGSYGGTLKGAGAEVILGPTGNSANTYKIGPGETVTVANNTIGWWVVAAGAAAADLQRQAYTAFSTAGAAPAYTLTPVPAVGALAAGHRFMVIFHAAGTTGSNTLNVSGLGAASLWQYDATGTLVPAVIPAAGIRGDVEYDGASWILLNPLPTAGAPSPVRQTVLGGPVDASGAPSFLPATAAGLSITSQNLAAGAPLVVSAANGFAAQGAVDRIGMSTANLTWSSLAPSATNYLYVDVSLTGLLTPGITTLAPIYQQGGARSTTNGQAVFNISEMSMTVGIGSTAPQAYRVFVGEAVTGAGSVTSTVAYAYQGRSAFLQSSLAVGTTYAFGANIGTPAPMQVVTGWLECKTAELGYAVGESIGVTWAVNPYIAAQSVYMTTVNRNRVDMVTGATNIGTTAKAGTTGVGLTTANWQLRATAWRGW